MSTLSGFDFLGWDFKVKTGNNKFVSYPYKKNRKQMIDKIKRVMRDTRYKLLDRFKMVKTIYCGWLNYHQFCDMSQINLWSIRQWVYKYAKKSSSMPGKGINEHIKAIFNGHTYRVNRHSAVRGDMSVYDGNLDYWSKRNSKL